MLPKHDLESISLRLGDPFAETQDALDSLKTSDLTGLDDVIQYAVKVLDVYKTASSDIDQALKEVNERADYVAGSFSQSSEAGNLPIFNEEDSTWRNLTNLDLKVRISKKLAQAGIDAIKNKKEIRKRLQQELANDYVDIRTFMGYVIFKTLDEGKLGMELDKPEKGIRVAGSALIGYVLKGQVAPIPGYQQHTNVSSL